MWKEYDYSQWNVQTKFSCDLLLLAALLIYVCMYVYIYIYIYIYIQTHTHKVQKELGGRLCNVSTSLHFIHILNLYYGENFIIFFSLGHLSVCNTNNIILKYLHSCYSFILPYLLFFFFVSQNTNISSLPQAPKSCLHLLWCKQKYNCILFDIYVFFTDFLNNV